MSDNNFAPTTFTQLTLINRDRKGMMVPIDHLYLPIHIFPVKVVKMEI